MEQPEKARYTTVFYAVRAKLDISWVEYIFLEMVYHLSYKTGYCYKSSGFIAEDLGIDRRSVNRIVARLEAEGLMERYKRTYRVTDKYVKLQSVSETKSPTYPNKRDKMSHSGTKSPLNGTKSPPEQGVRIIENNNKEGFNKYKKMRGKLGL